LQGLSVLFWVFARSGCLGGEIWGLGIPSSFSFLVLCGTRGFIFDLRACESFNIRSYHSGWQILQHPASPILFLQNVKNILERRKQQVGRLDLAAGGYLVIYSRGMERMGMAKDISAVYFVFFPRSKA